jgi:hypothetical protein
MTSVAVVAALTIVAAAVLAARRLAFFLVQLSQVEKCGKSID